MAKAPGTLNGKPVRIDTYVGDGGDNQFSTPLTYDLSQDSYTYYSTQYGVGGNDLLWAGAWDSKLYGGEGSDQLFGGDGKDVLDGGDGADNLTSIGLRDTVDGGEGHDNASVNLAAMTTGVSAQLASGSANINDSIHIKNVEVISLTTGSGNDFVTITQVYAAFVTMGNGDDVVTLIGKNSSTEVVGLDGGGNTDRLIVDFGGEITAVNISSGSVLLWDGEAFAQEARYDRFENYSLTGGSAADLLSGAEGDDILIGGKGNDDLYGGRGVDILDGGAGVDRVNMTFQYDVPITFDGRFASTAGGVMLADGSQVRNAEIFLLTMSGGDDHVVLGSYSDSIFSDNGDDTVTVIGANLDGQSDYINGGSGIDRLVVDLGSVATGVRMGATYVQRWTGAEFKLEVDPREFEVFNFTGGSGDDSLSGGFYDDVLYGGAGADQMDGASGSDQMNGGRGADSMYGGQGDDFYWIDDLGDVAVEFAGGGLDTVYTSLKKYNLGACLENAVLLGTGDIQVTGNGEANHLTGNAGANKLAGGDGQDWLEGGDGDDILGGDAENDTLIGGLGADQLTGGKGNDVFVYLTAQDSTLARHDLITDLKGKDIIDLSVIDADTVAAGDQAFRLVAGFTGARGDLKLTYDAASDRTTLEADITGDGLADFMLQIEGSHLSAADWLL